MTGFLETAATAEFRRYPLLEFARFYPLERFLRSADQTDIASIVVEAAAQTAAIATGPKIDVLSISSAGLERTQ